MSRDMVHKARCMSRACGTGAESLEGHLGGQGSWRPLSFTAMIPWGQAASPPLPTPSLLFPLQELLAHVFDDIFILCYEHQS